MIRLAMGKEQRGGRGRPGGGTIGLGHDVDRIVQEHLAEPGGGRAHEDAGLRLAAHQDGQRADVVQVRMGDQDRVERAVGDGVQVGQGGVALLLGMHPAIEHQAAASELQVVAVRSNFRGPGQVGETHCAGE